MVVGRKDRQEFRKPSGSRDSWSGYKQRQWWKIRRTSSQIGPVKMEFHTENGQFWTDFNQRTISVN